jgi:hypothetical protein
MISARQSAVITGSDSISLFAPVGIRGEATIRPQLRFCRFRRRYCRWAWARAHAAEQYLTPLVRCCP